MEKEEEEFHWLEKTKKMNWELGDSFYSNVAVTYKLYTAS